MRFVAVTSDTTIKMIAALAPHTPILKTQPSLLPAIDEMINPAIHITKITAQAMRIARTAGLVFINEPTACT
jgi:hypothetical protein